MSLSGMRAWVWGLHISSLSGDIDLLDDTNEMQTPLMFSCLDQQYRLFRTKAVFLLLSGRILELGFTRGWENLQRVVI